MPVPCKSMAKLREQVRSAQATVSSQCTQAPVASKVVASHHHTSTAASHTAHGPAARTEHTASPPANNTISTEPDATQSQHTGERPSVPGVQDTVPRYIHPCQQMTANFCPGSSRQSAKSRLASTNRATTAEAKAKSIFAEARSLTPPPKQQQQVQQAQHLRQNSAKPNLSSVLCRKINRDRTPASTREAAPSLPRKPVGALLPKRQIASVGAQSQAPNMSVLVNNKAPRMSNAQCNLQQQGQQKQQQGQQQKQRQKMLAEQVFRLLPSEPVMQSGCLHQGCSWQGVSAQTSRQTTETCYHEQAWFADHFEALYASKCAVP